MKLEVNDGIVKGIPLAILVTVLVQGATGVWWVSAKARDTYFLEQRVVKLEVSAAAAQESQGQLMQRLARIEERVNAQVALLERIDKQLTAAR